MKNIYKQLVTVVILATTGLSGTLMAESNSVNGATPLSAAAQLDFQINIPGILRFRVGSDAGTIDLVQFTPTAENLGDDSDIAGTGGDLSGGEVTVNLFSNAGQITITPTNSGTAGLENGEGDTISYDEIITTSSDAAVLPVPVLSDAGGTTSQPPPTSGLRVTNLNESWTYTYDNTEVYPEGTYGGENTQGGRVTYTAATP